ncbi:MAG TPA: phosphoribosylformylglycinamidine synthase I [Pirellulales bacterium]|jgi:phosphoribosylformylglycinamidine synthase|nr:phosphoribosylformylglycinamidine synthase I [Pirellulales bacterium]
MKPRVLVLRAPGANCDLESAFAFERAGAVAERVHVNRLLERDTLLAGYQILCLPGGFSYGDDLGAGRILGSQIRHHLRDALHEFKAAGKLVLGICNGFQILVKSGLLLDDDDAGRPAATLTNNESGKFEDRWIRLHTMGNKCVFFWGIDTMYLPVAHAEGKFVPRDAATFRALESAGQLVLRYSAVSGEKSSDVAYPANPNGSVGGVAGVCDSTGRVCGLMPHPERHIDPTQHPRWTRQALAHEGDGLRVFRNAVRFFS